MKTCSITICFFYLFGMAAGYQNTEDVIALDESFVDIVDEGNNGLNLEEKDVMEQVDVIEIPVEMEEENIGINLEAGAIEEVGDIFDSPVEIVDESPAQRYMRGSVALEDKEDTPKRDLVAKGGTYVAAKGGTYLAAKGTNIVPVTTNYYVYKQEKERPRRYYGKGKGKGGGYYGGYGGYGSYYDSYGYSASGGYYDSYGYSGYGGYGGGYYGY
jgi:hypothetical protein